jgi:hypothetical protein
VLREGIHFPLYNYCKTNWIFLVKVTSKTKKKYIDIYSVKYLCRKNNFISKVLCHTRKVYLCIKGTDFASFYDFRNVTDSVIFFVLVLLCHLFSLFFFFILFEPLDIVTPNKSFINSFSDGFHQQNIPYQMLIIFLIILLTLFVVSNTYCVVFLFFLSSSCCPILWILLFRLSVRYSLTLIN